MIKSAIGATENHAREKLQKTVLVSLDEHQKHADNYRRCTIFVQEEENILILLVEYRHYSWGYAFVRPGQSYMSGGTVGLESFEEARDMALKHAADLGEIIGKCGC